MLFMYKLYEFRLLKNGLFIYYTEPAHDTTNNLNVPSLVRALNVSMDILESHKLE